LLDEAVAEDLGVELQSAQTLNISGLGGMVREVRLALVTVHLLDRPQLSATLEVGFATDIERSLGNLIRLDILEEFDLGLSHGRRIGYLSRTP
jgi:hypothetical protein